jgi:hypothetical protein
VVLTALTAEAETATVYSSKTHEVLVAEDLGVVANIDLVLHSYSCQHDLVSACARPRP